MLKVFIASAIGAGIGAFIALELSPTLAWLGALIGFVAGYLTYEFKKVISAIPQAFRATPRLMQWRPNSLLWRGGLWLGVLTASIASILYLPVILTMPSEHRMPVETAIFGMAMMGACVFLLFFFTTVRLIGSEKEVRELRQVAINCTPPMVVFYWLPKAIWLMVRHGLPKMVAFVMKAATLIATFARELFIRVHSDVRLLCGTDAFLGASIGYFSGSTIMGTLAGGTLGLLNYELVSKRWLKLVPR